MPSIKLIYQQLHFQPKMETSGKPELAETGLRADHIQREHDDQLPLSFDHQVDRICGNLKFYVSLLIQDMIPVAEVEELKKLLLHQLELINSEFIHTEEINRLSDIVTNHDGQQVDGYGCFQNINQFGNVIKELLLLRQDIQSEEEFKKTSAIIEGFLKEMQIIIKEDNYTINRLEKYEIYANNIEGSVVSNDREVEELKPTHYWKQQKIIFTSELPPSVFQQWVHPPLHRLYISEVTKVYHQVVPFKIKHVNLSSLDDPVIKVPNYFNPDIDSEKQIIFFCKPGTKNMFSYRLDDICKLLTIEKEYIQQNQLPIAWNFSPFVRTLITPDGKIFAINCKSSQSKIDPCMYQITADKVSNKGKLLNPKLNSSFIYCNKNLYVIGGNGVDEPCTIKNYCYSFKDKKWRQIADSNIAVRKPTVCSFRDRYIVKLGGLNQFDYISKGVQMYDTLTNNWSIVRASPKNVLEQVQILEDSLAAQIGEDQIYVFSGKNGNNYQTDTGFVLQFMEIRQKRKGPARVSGQLWNMSIGKKNIYSFFGLFSQSNVITHHNCLYAMRTEFSKSLCG